MTLREITDVNTKARRLGYLPVLLGLVRERSLGAEVLVTRFVEWGKANQDHLKNYRDSTGDIVPQAQPERIRTGRRRSSYAAKRYIELALAAGWLTQISGMYAITRIGRVLLALGDTLPECQTSNPFILPVPQRLFFAYELWRKDGDILYTLLQMLSGQPIPLRQIQKDFQEAFLEHLAHRMRQVSSEYEHRALLDRRNNVAAWQSPARYAEHIAPPRLHWLVDLGLISIEASAKRACSLTAPGGKFKEHFSSLTVLTDEWLETNFFKTATEYLLPEGIPRQTWQPAMTESSRAAQARILEPGLRAAFTAFQRGPIPKLSMTPVVLFLSVYLIVQHDVVADARDILQALSKPLPFDEDHVLETRLSARENESYLILNPV